MIAASSFASMRGAVCVVVRHPDARFPINSALIEGAELEDFSKRLHWHEEVEACHLVKGSLTYQVQSHHVGDSEVELQEGDCLLVNTRRAHIMLASDDDCRFTFALFRPDIISNNEEVVSTYVYPLLVSGNFDYLLLRHGESRCDVVGAAVDDIVKAQERKPPAYRLEQVNLVQRIWLEAYRELDEIGKKRRPQGLQSVGSVSPDDALSLRQMLLFIYAHYQEKIKLDEIASAGNMKRSKACEVFGKYVGLSPVEFLNTYRISSSQRMLVETDNSIGSIAATCGFSSQSYFTRAFVKATGSTPREYRKKAVIR